MDKEKVLVTGGSGYFGTLLINKLLSKGYTVDSLDVNPPNFLPSGVRFHHCDIRNKRRLSELIQGYKIIFHNVAQVPLAKDKKLFFEVNEIGTKNICDVSLINGVNKLVYTSSSAVYGLPKNNPVNENSNRIPAEAYGQAKLNGENICEEYSRKGLSIIIIRPRTILGHGRLGIFSILFKWVNEGVKIPVLDGGRNIYQFIHSDDLADACILASRTNHKFSHYNIGSEAYGTMRETLEDLCAYAGTGAKVYSLPLKPIEFGMNVFSRLGLIPLGPYHSLMYGRSMYFDISKAKSDFGFRPKYSNKDMFRESYDWYLKNIEKINSSNDNSFHNKPVKESFLIFNKLIARFF